MDKQYKWPKEKGGQKTQKTQKTKDRASQTSLKQGVNSGAPEGQAVLASLATSLVLL